MGSILIDVPNIEDDELVYNAEETKLILKFFFTSQAVEIDALSVDNNVRRFAQTLLIAGLDATYALGFIGDLVEVLTEIIKGGKSPGIAGLAKKLAKKYIKRWWKHTQIQNLNNAKIYLSIRDAIAFKAQGIMGDILNNSIASANRLPNGLRVFISDKIINKRVAQA
jgi:hypothetical protein